MRIEFGKWFPKGRPLLLIAVAVIGLSGCGPSILATPLPSPNYELTKVVGTLEALRVKLDRVAPTITAFAAQPKEFVELDSSSTASSASTATLIPTASQALLEPSPTGLPSLMPTTSTKPDYQTIVMQDNFSSKSGWFQGETDQFKAANREGGYGITVKVTEKPVWSVRKIDAADVQIEADVIHVGGAEDGFFGLVCRQKGTGNYYYLAVSPNGAVEVAKVKDYQVQYLERTNHNPWQLAGQALHLRADCIGNTLTLSVNGELVISATDDEFSSGGVGLVTGDRSKSGTDVIFDNFLVLSP